MQKVWTPLCDQLGIDYPIFEFAHNIATVATITNAEGYGVYGETRPSPDEIRQELALIRHLVGEKPFGVDLILPPGMPEHNSREAIEAEISEEHKSFVAGLIKKSQVPPASAPGMRTRFIRSSAIREAQVQAVLESSVNMFACGISALPEVPRRAKALGKTTLALIGGPHHIQRAVATSVDMLVAQGYDDGAHTGPIGTYGLVPLIVDAAGNAAVLVAGGVATGRTVAAGLAMGTAGVWVGTACLLWKEHKEHKAHLHPVNTEKLEAAESGNTVITRSESGKTFRQIKSVWSQGRESEDAPKPLKMPYQDVLVGDLLGAIKEHDIKPLIHSGAGQSISYFDEVRAVKIIKEGLVKEASAVLGTPG